MGSKRKEKKRGAANKAGTQVRGSSKRGGGVWKRTRSVHPPFLPSPRCERGVAWGVELGGTKSEVRRSKKSQVRFLIFLVVVVVAVSQE